MIDSQQLYRLMLMNTIGLSILFETFHMAAKYFIAGSGTSEARSCYVFLQGTGLEALLMNYDLDYNADGLRNGFNWYIKHQNGNGNQF